MEAQENTMQDLHPGHQFEAGYNDGLNNVAVLVSVTEWYDKGWVSGQVEYDRRLRA